MALNSAGLGGVLSRHGVHPAPSFSETHGPHHAPAGVHLLPGGLQEQRHRGLCRLFFAGFRALRHRHAAAAGAEPDALHSDAL